MHPAPCNKATLIPPWSSKILTLANGAVFLAVGFAPQDQALGRMCIGRMCTGQHPRVQFDEDPSSLPETDSDSQFQTLLN